MWKKLLEFFKENRTDSEELNLTIGISTQTVFLYIAIVLVILFGVIRML